MNMQTNLDITFELRQRSITLIIIFISLSIWIFIIWSSIYLRAIPTKLLFLGILAEGICGLCWELRESRYAVASGTLVVGLWLCNSIIIQLVDPLFLLYLFSPITLITSILMSFRFSIGISFVSTAVILAMGDDSNASSNILPVLSMWFVCLISFVHNRSFQEILRIVQDYARYSVEQMQQARDHRAQLVTLTQSLRQSQENLQRYAMQLRHARDAAEEAERLKVEFAASVSHELRTPINLIVGFTEMIVMNQQVYGTPLPMDYWSDIQAVYRSAKHLQDLINDVLDMSQITTAQMAVVKEETNVLDILRDVVNLVRDSIESKGLSFNVMAPESAPKIYLDQIRIRQVLLNLLNNAVRFTDSGSITLQLTKEDTEFKFRVNDTGTGISPLHQTHIFDQFYQADGSLSKKRGGTGLGLTLSKTFVELHNGRIWVESEGIPGKGSTISFTLPFDTSYITRGIKSIEYSPFNSPQHFIFFDDEPTNIQLFEGHIRSHRVIGVQDAHEVLQLIETTHPTALVLAHHLATSGIVEAVRKPAPNLPMIICHTPTGIRRIRESGIIHFLVRPISYDTLRSIVDSLSPSIERILIIEDDHDMMRLLSRMFDALPSPTTVWKAYSGAEGLALLAQQPLDAIFLKPQLADMDGFAVVQQIRANPMLSDIPIIMISGPNSIAQEMSSDEEQILLNVPRGLQPIELVHCVEGLVDALIPGNRRDTLTKPTE